MGKSKTKVNAAPKKDKKARIDSVAQRALEEAKKKEASKKEVKPVKPEKKVEPPKKTEIKKKKKSSSSDSSSSDSSSVEKLEKGKKASSTSSSSSDSSSGSSSESSPKKSSPPPKEKESKKEKESSSGSSSDSSSGSSSDSSSSSKKKSSASSSGSSSGSSSDSSSSSNKKSSGSSSSSDESEAKKGVKRKADSNENHSEPPSKKQKTEEVPASEDGENLTVFIKNVSFKATEEQVIEFFNDCGKVLKVEWLPSKFNPGSFSGIGWVLFDSQEAKTKALAKSGQSLVGRDVEVNFSTRDLARPQSQGSRTPPAQRATRGCFTCGSADHKSFECPEKPAGGAGRGTPQRGGGACFTCGAADHKSFECPEKPAGGSGRGTPQRGGGGRACFTCGSTEHMASACPDKSSGGGRGGATPNRPARSTQKNPKIPGGKTLFMGNLSDGVDEEQVKTFFKDCGEISEIRWMVKDGVFKGMGWADFQDSDAVDKAFSKDQQVLCGRSIRLDYPNK